MYSLSLHKAFDNGIFCDDEGDGDDAGVCDRYGLLPGDPHRQLRLHQHRRLRLHPPRLRQLLQVSAAVALISVDVNNKQHYSTVMKIIMATSITTHPTATANATTTSFSRPLLLLPLKQQLLQQLLPLPLLLLLLLLRLLLLLLVLRL